MTFNIIGSILPEVTIAVAICIVILVNSLLRNASVTLIHSLVLFFLSFALFLSFVSLEIPDSNIFDGHYVIDAFGTNLKIIALLSLIHI